MPRKSVAVEAPAEVLEFAVNPDSVATPVVHALMQLQDNTGRVTPEMVVEAARDEASPLHGCFDWDDRSAAHGYRLLQAARLIRRAQLKLVLGDRVLTVRALVSLGSDRVEGGGYRALPVVMNDDELRGDMLRTALAELRSFRKRFQALRELSSVFGAIDSLVEE